MNFLRCFCADEHFPGSQHVVVLERGNLIEMFSQLGLQWKKNYKTSRLPQTLNNYVPFC